MLLLLVADIARCMKHDLASCRMKLFETVVCIEQDRLRNLLLLHSGIHSNASCCSGIAALGCLQSSCLLNSCQASSLLSVVHAHTTYPNRALDMTP